MEFGVFSDTKLPRPFFVANLGHLIFTKLGDLQPKILRPYTAAAGATSHHGLVLAIEQF